MSLKSKFFNYLENYTINREKLYIIPTKFGFIYTAIMFTLFLIGLTYGNNLTLSIAFVLFTYFVLQMLGTHKNLSLLKIQNIHFESDFADADNKVSIILKDPIPEDNYRLQINKKYDFQLNTTPLGLTGRSRIPRGYYPGEYIKLINLGQSGLFYTWTFFKVKFDFYIYPAIKKVPFKKKFNQSVISNRTEENEFNYHVPYGPGHSSKRIDWKVFAKNDDLYWKKFSREDKDHIRLQFKDFDGSCEERLSAMTYCLNICRKENLSWSFYLPGIVEKNCTNHHDYLKCLQHLAEYQCNES